MVGAERGEVEREINLTGTLVRSPFEDGIVDEVAKATTQKEYDYTVSVVVIVVYAQSSCFNSKVRN